jgi:hypothetical protein
MLPNNRLIRELQLDPLQLMTRQPVVPEPANAADRYFSRGDSYHLQRAWGYGHDGHGLKGIARSLVQLQFDNEHSKVPYLYQYDNRDNRASSSPRFVTTNYRDPSPEVSVF